MFAFEMNVVASDPDDSGDNRTDSDVSRKVSVLNYYESTLSYFYIIKL